MREQLLTECSVAVADVGSSPGRTLEMGIGLNRDEHCRIVVPFRQIETLRQPDGIGRAAPRVFGVHLRRAAEIVVAAGDVQADEQCRADATAYILAVFGYFSPDRNPPPARRNWPRCATRIRCPSPACGQFRLAGGGF